MQQTVTMEMIYSELKSIRQELARVEYAVMPVEKLSSKELKEHMQDLEAALKGARSSFRSLQ